MGIYVRRRQYFYTNCHELTMNFKELFFCTRRIIICYKNNSRINLRIIHGHLRAPQAKKNYRISTKVISKQPVFHCLSCRYKFANAVFVP